MASRVVALHVSILNGGSLFVKHCAATITFNEYSSYADYTMNIGAL